MARKVGRPRSKHTSPFDNPHMARHWKTIRAAHRRALLETRRLNKRMVAGADGWNEASIMIDKPVAQAIADALNEGMTRTQLHETLTVREPRERYMALLHRDDNWWEFKPWVRVLEQTFE